MHKKTLILFILWHLAYAKEYSAILDPEERFEVTWSFEETTPTSYVTFTVCYISLKDDSNKTFHNQDLMSIFTFRVSVLLNAVKLTQLKTIPIG